MKTQSKQQNRALVLTDLFICVSLFSYGTAMMDYFVLYPSRFAVGESEFVAFHKILEERIVPVSVLPFFVMTVLNIALFWFRPGKVSKTLLWISLVCLLLDWASTIALQIPMNMKLGEGKDLQLMNAIDNTNWGRVVLESTQAVIVFLILRKR